MSGSTGQLVGGVIGAAIGFYVTGGNPQGAMLGFALGSGVGGLIDPPNEMPRRDDLKVQKSEYGAPIPILYSIPPVAPNIPWCSELIPVNGSGSGKGGDEPKSTTYLVHLMAMVGEPGCGDPRVLGNIFAGPEKRLVYDHTTGETESGTITFYSGTDDQLPDPLMESFEGVGHVPAYRGLCYLVWENFSTENDGNMPPFLTIETGKGTDDPVANGDLGIVYPLGKVFVDEAAGTYAVSYSGANDGVLVRNLGDNSFVANWDNGTGIGDTHSFYDADRHRIVYIEDTTVTWIDLDTGTGGSWDAGTTWPMPGGAATTGGYRPAGGVYHNGRWTFLMHHASAGTAISTVDPDGLTGDQFYTGDAGFPAFALVDFCDRRQEGDTYIVGITKSGTVRKFPLSAAYTSIDCGACPANAQAFDLDPSTGLVWSMTFSAGTLEVSVNSVLFAVQAYAETITTTAFSWGGPRRTNPWVFKPYDELLSTSGRVLLVFEKWLGLDYFVEFDGGSFLLPPSLLALIDGTYHGLATARAGWYDTTNDQFWFVRDYGWGNRPESGDLTDVRVHDDQNDSDPGSGFLLGQQGAQALGKHTLDEILGDLTTRAESTNTWDASGCTDVVDGFAVGSQMNVRAAVESLRPAYWFDVREHATATSVLIEFIKRGTGTVREVPDADVGAYQAGSQPPAEPMLTTRRMENELPRTLSVNYTLAATDYSAATRYARRLIGSSGEEKTLDLPMVLTDTKAQQVAEVNLHAEWVGRLSHTFTLPREYADAEPGDLLGIFGQTVRLTQTTQSHGGGVIQCAAVTDDSAGYTPHVVVTETPPNAQTVDQAGLTLMDMM